jgi:hypothetical protein
MNKNKEYEKAKALVRKYERTLERQAIIDSLKGDEQYIVRQYDYFDHLWFDITKPASKQEVIIVWDKHTKKGNRNSKCEDGDYYRIFPSNTRMIYS